MTNTSATFTLSAFGDEIADDVETQLEVLNELGIGWLELRKAWGTNVLDLDDSQIDNLRDKCSRHSMKVSCIGSPVGKSPIEEPLETVLSDLSRILDIAETLNTGLVRVFSFYPPEGASLADYVDRSISRLTQMADMAAARGILLLLENEGGLVGDTPGRCLTLLEGVDSPGLSFVWDTGNFPHSGVSHAFDRGWPLLGSWVACVQVKDALVADQTITVAGGGDGQIPELLVALRESGYCGFLALEPHLKVAGQRGGFSGPDGMRRAAEALRNLMTAAGCQETVTPGSQ
ncbi:MAG: sugar phosphate isomerase/epimerase family protein [SAR202 cluster bacterium]|jgi:sugar phosphate isomerase/epimerase|nr:sugar phosphate isomerase/epimerase family protein [SAR202 cluster bacterium]